MTKSEKISLDYSSNFLYQWQWQILTETTVVLTKLEKAPLSKGTN